MPQRTGGHTKKSLILLRLLEQDYPEIDSKELYAAILCGEIRVNGETVRDSNRSVAGNPVVEWTRAPYVSRGGLKLQGALDAWNIDPRDWICLDAGASTGGFTDCLLQRGAAKVHAVDVGYNQLAWKLRSDPRVLVRERCNIMSLTPEDLNPPPVFATADLSFRSLRGAAAQILRLIGGGSAVVLVKPQFEGAAEVGFDGVVRNADERKAVVMSLYKDLLDEGVSVKNAIASPVTGRKGNAELFFHLEPTSRNISDPVEEILQALEDAESRQKSFRLKGLPTQKPSPPR